MTDQPSAFELRLRRTLVDLRPAEGAPDALRTRVETIPDRPARAWWGAPARTLAGALTVVAVGAVIAVVIAFRPIPGPVTPIEPGGVPKPTFDPLIEGPGIIHFAASTLVVVPIIVALVIAAVGLRWALRERWHMLTIRLAIVVVVAGGVGALAVEPGFEQGSFYGPVMGYDLQVEPPPGADYPTVWYETAEPGGPLVLVVTLRNPGPLPIQLDGLVETQTSETPLIQRWTALWLGADPNSIGSIDQAVPFTPTVVEPQRELQVYLVGRAGLCAYGPGYTVGSPVTGHSSRGRELRFSYSILSLQSTAPFELPMSLVEPYRENCPSA